MGRTVGSRTIVRRATAGTEVPSARSDPPPAPLGRFLTASQFWELMERWRVPDAQALELLEFAGKIGKSGKRPRFRFGPHQKRVTTDLSEIDAALASAGQDPAWLTKQSRSAPFQGKAPLAFMI